MKHLSLTSKPMIKDALVFLPFSSYLKKYYRLFNILFISFLFLSCINEDDLSSRETFEEKVPPDNRIIEIHRTLNFIESQIEYLAEENYLLKLKIKELSKTKNPG